VDPDRRLVRRVCQVCEWEGTAVEPPAQTDCPWCHAPTRIVQTDVVTPAGADKNPHAAALGRLGGLKGGKARADRLSERRRREIARKAAQARWKKR
jgi:hypothetical protein